MSLSALLLALILLPYPALADDWLSTSGNRIVDENGSEVWITGVNWFGYNTGTNTFDGLWSANLSDLVTQIADRGFNLIRVPFSAELIQSWSLEIYPQANINEWTNADLKDLNSLEIFDVFLNLCEINGLKVMIDIHSARTDPMGHMANMWYTDDFSAEEYFAALEWMAARYRDNDTIIAYDLKNEPHGKPGESPRAIWNGSESEDNWKYAAERAALRILYQNPRVLIVIEGIEIYPKDLVANGNFSSVSADDYYYNWWGGNLRGVRDAPVDLGEYQGQVVYSPHDYGPAVYQQPWFYEGFTYDSLYRDCWRDNWMYIHEEEISPLIIGEWGGYLEGDNLTWLEHLRTLIIENRICHTYWCLNANSGDTGGLLQDDFITFDEQRYAFVKPTLWQVDGKFVGLDAEVPLGKNGRTRR